MSARDILEASIPLVPFALAFGAAGAALTGSVPRATVAILGILASAGYLLYDVGPIFKWPGWLNDLSAFRLYGTPLTTGIYWGGFWALTAVTLIGFAAALLTMQRREVGR